MENKGSYVVKGSEGESYRFLRLGEIDGQPFLLVLFNNKEAVRVFKQEVQGSFVDRVEEVFTELTRRLSSRGHDPLAVLNFFNRVVFCMLAEGHDTGILPERVFSELLESILRVLKKFNSGKNHFQQRVGKLFETMCTGGFFGVHEIGRVDFKETFTLPLEKEEIKLLLAIARDFQQGAVYV
jgi:hypothetical protein